ncbi:unnamed protein product [Brassica rapa subsp. narinosa]
MSVHSPCKALSSFASSLSKVFLSICQLTPPPFAIGIHHHFVLYGLMEYLGRSFDRQFLADEVLHLLDEMLKSDDIDILNH